MILPIAAGVLAFLTMVMLWVGLRGRVVTEHPVCRGCHFDLIGSRDAARCPECGAELGRKRAVQWGLRKRRRWAVVLGLLTLVMFLGTAGVMSLPLVTNVDWNQYKPNWMLMQEAQAAVTPDDAVLKELMLRRAVMEIGPAAYQALIEHALARQLDAKLKWSEVWGDLVEDANTRGDIPGAVYDQFLANGVLVNLSIGEKVVVGQGVPFQIECVGLKLGSTSTVCLSIGEMVATVQGDQGPIVNRFDTGWGSSSGGGSGRVSTKMQVPLKTTIPAGKHKSTISVGYRVSKNWKTPAVRSGVVDVTKEIEFVEGAARAVVMKADESQRPALLAWFKNTRIKHDSTARPTGYIQLDMRGDKLPVNVSFKVIARETLADGSTKDWAFPSLAIQRGNGGYSTNVQGPRGFAAKRVTLVLKADPTPASGLSGMNEAWDGDLEIPNVVVEPMYPEAAGMGAGAAPRK